MIYLILRNGHPSKVNASPRTVTTCVCGEGVRTFKINSLATCKHTAQSINYSHHAGHYFTELIRDTIFQRLLIDISELSKACCIHAKTCCLVAFICLFIYLVFHTSPLFPTSYCRTPASCSTGVAPHRLKSPKKTSGVFLVPLSISCVKEENTGTLRPYYVPDFTLGNTPVFYFVRFFQPPVSFLITPIRRVKNPRSFDCGEVTCLAIHS